MRIGVQLPEVESPITWSELRDVAAAVEDCGFDSVWLGDHLLYRDDAGSRGPFEAWSTLAALAEATERVEIGPLVAATAFHAPALLAKKAATVDDISGGRLILGLGAGWNRVEFEAFGFPFDNRVSRFAEAFTIIHALIREGFIDFEGEFFTVRDCELIPRARRDIKFLIGSNGPRMLGLVAPHVQMWNTWFTGYGNRATGYGNDVGGLAPLLEKVNRALADGGAEPDSVEKTAAVFVKLPRRADSTAGSRVDPGVEPVMAAELDERFAEFAELGLAEIQVVLDPIDTGGVEDLARLLGRI